MRVAAPLAYLVVTGLACVPMFARPDSHFSGVLVFVVTIPWSIILGIPISMLMPELVDTRVGFLFVSAMNAALNALLIFWAIGKVRRGATR
jgi:hypothetical protein